MNVTITVNTSQFDQTLSRFLGALERAKTIVKGSQNQPYDNRNQVASNGRPNYDKA